MPWLAAFSSRAVGEELPGLRRRVQARLRVEGASAQVIERVGVLVSELAHNAAEACSRGSRVHVTLRDRAPGLELAVECVDNCDFEEVARGLAASVELPQPEDERGRGLWLVRQWSRGLRVERGRGGWVRLALTVREDGD